MGIPTVAGNRIHRQKLNPRASEISEIKLRPLDAQFAVKNINGLFKC
jgi:hypothetical protein